MVGPLVDLRAIVFHFLVKQVILIDFELTVVDLLVDKLLLFFLVVALGALMDHIWNRDIAELSPLSLFNPLNEPLDNVISLDNEQQSYSYCKHDKNRSECIDEASTNQQNNHEKSIDSIGSFVDFDLPVHFGVHYDEHYF